MGSVSAEGNASDVNNGGAGHSNKLGVFEFNDRHVLGDGDGSIKNEKSVQRKEQRREEGKSKGSKSPVYDSMISVVDDFAANVSVTVAAVGRSSMEVSSGHGFEVGDMVWGKVKSHPWWPGHVYSEEFANPSVRRSKREGLLLVAFFGDSSYGWFHPSELIPFDSNFAEKSRQTNSRTFVKAVEEAVEEVSRRSALGLSCMCRNKQNFRQTEVQGFFSVDVLDYDPGAIYSIDTIGKARDRFQPETTLDFVRQLALEPRSSEHVDIDFIKNKASVVSYRKAVYEEFDETYAQAFGYQSSPESVQESHPGKASKAPLSGRQVFADSSGKGKSPAKLNKPKDHAKKDKYIFKRRDEPKEIKTHQKEKGKVTGHVEDPVAVAAGDYMLQKRVSATQKQFGAAVTNDELAFSDATGTGASMEDVPVILDFGNPGSSVDDEKRIVTEMEDQKTSSGLVDDKSSSEAKVSTQDDIPSLGLHKMVATQRVDGGPKKTTVSKRPIGELGSGKSILPGKKKKRKKESLMPDGAPILQEGVLANKPFSSALAPKPPIEDTQRTNGKATTGLGNNEVELSRVLGDLQSLALDPFHAINKGSPVKVRQVFLKYRSLVFQKSLNLPLLADDESSVMSSTGDPENGLQVKPQARSSGRPDDPTKGGRKRGPSDRQEEIAAIKKKRLGDIRNLTKEKKVVKKIDEPTARGDDKQAAVTTSRKMGPELIKKTEPRAPEPMMLMMKFPAGGSLPSINELKARFARYGPMDHSATRIYWNTFTCRVVYRNKAHAQAAYKFVVGSSSLFGNTGVKCMLKDFAVVGSAEPESPLKDPKEDPSGAHDANQPVSEDRPSVLPAPPGVQLKSCLKKSSGEEVGDGGGTTTGRGMPRVKFMLEEKNGSSFGGGAGASSFSSSSHATMDFDSKIFHHKAVHQSNTSVASSTSQFTTPPPPSYMHYGTAVAPPLPPGPPPQSSLNHGGVTAAQPDPSPPTPSPPNVDLEQQMLSLLTKCNDVVTNVTCLLGYVPYHPL